MRAVLQRVSRARVQVAGREVGKIGSGLLVFVAAAASDCDEDVDYLADKIAHLRILPDHANRMNQSLLDSGCEALLISQFTLLGNTRKGRRPSFTAAAKNEVAEALLGNLTRTLRALGVKVGTGEFGSHMDVELVNDGPVTILIDSNDRNTPRRHD